MQLSPGDKRTATFVRQSTGARGKGPESRVKDQGSRIKGQEGISKVSDKIVEDYTNLIPCLFRVNPSIYGIGKT